MSFSEWRDRVLAALLKRTDPTAAWTQFLAADEATLHTPEGVKHLVQLYERHPDPRAEPLLRKIAGVATLDITSRFKAAGILGYRASQLAEDDPAGAEALAVTAADAFEAVAADLTASQRADPDLAGWLWSKLARCHALAGEAHHDRAVAAWQEALRVAPNPDWEFNLGLLYKRRARWGEALAIFQRLVDAGHRGEEYLWNLGICATGAGSAPVALRAWKDLGMIPTVGDDGLPRVADLGRAKVRLSRPPTADESEYGEHLFLRRVSPCHGELLNPTMEDLGADIGDLVVHDGDPIGHWHDANGHGHRFQALGLVRRGEWKTFRFRARGLDRKTAETISAALPGESALYVFAREIVGLGPSHAPADPAIRSGAGKLLVAPRVSLDDARAAFERAVSAHGGATIAVPALYEALGDPSAAARQQQLWDDLDD